MKARKLINISLYVLALLFLAWHLLPVAGTVSSSVAKKEPTLQELAATATCTSGDMDVLTYGNPLTQPLFTNRERNASVMNWTNGSADNLVANPNITQLQGSNPVGWTSDKYGDNQTQFSVVAGPNETSKALRVNIDEYNSGDSKWLMQTIPTAENQLVEFSLDYRSNQTADIVAVATDNDGDNRYLDMGRVVSTKSAWKTTRNSFVTPENTKSIQIAVILDQKGWVESSNYSVMIGEPGKFSRGIASVTFDDGWSSIYSSGLPIFKQYQIPTTQFVVAGYDGKAYMSEKQIREMQAAGQSIDSHSFSHARLTDVGNDQLQKELAGSQTILQNKFGSANNLATPFGAYTDALNSQITKCYQSHRTTDTGYNAPGYNRYQVRVQNVEVDTKPEQIRAWADYAQKNNLWLVLVYHQVEDGGNYSVDTKSLEAHFKALKDSGIHLASYNDALIETYSQGR